jgi:two-component system sensor histidine kinase QseC
MKSIRRTLTAHILLSLGVIGLACGCLLYVGVRSALTHQFDQALLARLGAAQSATRWDGTKIDMDFTAETMPWYRPGPHAEYFEIRSTSATGTLSGGPFASPSLEGRPWKLVLSPGTDIQDHLLPDGRPGRVALVEFHPMPEEDLDQKGREEDRRRAVESSPQLTLIVGIDRSNLDATLRIIAIALGCTGLVVMLGGFLAVRASIRRALAPLDALGKRVAEIQADSLATRLEDESLPDELRPMQIRINDLLGRLHEAFDREQRFTDAAAHELRTPVAELRMLFEVALSRPRTPEEQAATLREAHEITMRSEHLVQALLRVARTRGRPPAPVSLTSGPLGPFVKTIAARHAAAAERRGGRLEVLVQDDASAEADWESLESVLNNVIANAVEYCDQGTMVTCEVKKDGERVVAEVRNASRGLTADDVSRFFEPFWRKDASRASSHHLGMGLAIARGLAVGMQGSAEALLRGSDVVLRVSLKRGSQSAP